MGSQQGGNRPIVYAIPVSTVKCRIHGSTPCSSRCKGKAPAEPEAPEEPLVEITAKVQIGDELVDVSGLVPERLVHDTWANYSIALPDFGTPPEKWPRVPGGELSTFHDGDLGTMELYREMTAKDPVLQALRAHFGEPDPPPYCHHRGGSEDCGPACLLVYGDRFWTEVHPTDPEES